MVLSVTARLPYSKTSSPFWCHSSHQIKHHKARLRRTLRLHSTSAGRSGHARGSLTVISRVALSSMHRIAEASRAATSERTRNSAFPRFSLPWKPAPETPASSAAMMPGLSRSDVYACTHHQKTEIDGHGSDHECAPSISSGAGTAHT